MGTQRMSESDLNGVCSHRVRGDYIAVLRFVGGIRRRRELRPYNKRVGVSTLWLLDDTANYIGRARTAV